MLQLTAVSPDVANARTLIAELDADLLCRYPEGPIFGIDAESFNAAGGYFIVAQDGDELLGCGAFRPIDKDCVELKRLFVRPSARGHGVARAIVHALHNEIKRRGYRSCVLETGEKQVEAIALYESEGYFPIPRFLGYVSSPISRCFARQV